MLTESKDLTIRVACNGPMADFRLSFLHVTLALAVATGTGLFQAFPHGGDVLFTPEQAQKIDPDLMAKIRQMPADATVWVWFDILPDSPITPAMIEELRSLGATVRGADQGIHAVSAEVKVSDLPKFASLEYVVYIDEVAIGEYL